jgi:hypothetical protein
LLSAAAPEAGGTLRLILNKIATFLKVLADFCCSDKMNYPAASCGELDPLSD